MARYTALLSLSLSAAAASPIPCPSSLCYTSPPTFDSSAFSAWLLSFSPLPPSLRVAPGSYALPLPTGRAHLVLPPLANTSLDFSFVTLTCADRAGAGLYLSNWFNVSLTGLSLAYAAPPSSTAAITAVDAAAGTLDVVPEPGHPTEDFVAGTVASCNFFSPATRLRTPLAEDLYVSAVAPLGGGAFRLTASNAGQLKGVAAGDLVGCRVPGGGMTVTLEGTEGLNFSNVTLFGGPCFGFLESGGGGGNAFTNVSIRFPAPPPGALHPPLLSTSADGFHSSGARRGPRIEGALFEGMDDDGIAVHGGFMLVTDAAPFSQGGGGRVWATVHGALAPGDRVLFYDKGFAPVPAPPGPSFAPTFYVVLAVEPAARNYTPPCNASTTMPSQKLPAPIQVVTLGGGPPLPAALGFDFVLSNADAVGAGYVLRGNTIRNHRARGMLLKAPDGLVEGNAITNSSLGGIIITPELYWEEAGFSRNVTVRGNTVTLTSSGSQSYGGIALGAVAPGGALAVKAPGHAGVVIENNTLVDCGYAPIWLNAGGNVTLRGNRLVAPFHAPSPEGLPHCCMPLPAEAIAVLARGVEGLLAERNCVAPAPAGQGSLGQLLNVTECSGQWEGGVTLCA